MRYNDKVNELAKGISPNIVNLKTKRRRGTPPTQAFSDFLTHNEQGDWAEMLFFRSIKDSNSGLVPVRYGKSDKIIAGDPDFKDFYNQYQDELDEVGKRPDILVFEPNVYKEEWGEDISKLPKEKLASIVPLATAGFEVRSSAYLTKKFTAKKERPFLSFTPKVEDLMVVMKWIDNFNVPHFYVQVFFDAIYAISFREILLLLRDSSILEKGIKNKKIVGSINQEVAYVIEKNPKNQYKETIHIFLNKGHYLSKDFFEPKLLGQRKELASGRLLHHVSFEGGKANLDKDVFINIIKQEL